MTTPTTVQVRLQIRADTAANWTSFSPVLLANELGLETDTKKFKIGDGNTSWQSLAYFPSIVSGGTVLGNLEIGTTGTLTFEGSTANGFETTLGVVDPTADRTILLPNQSGTVVVGGNASIVDADIAANAEIAVSKLADGAARQLLQTDAAGTGVEWTSNIDIPGTLDVTGVATFDSAVTIAGDLTVNGTTTNINTQNLVVEDKNIILADVATPTDVTADGGGITLKGATDKTINWIDSTDAWTSSERFSVPLGSAAAPSLTFTGDPNTGIYSPGADQVAISTNGTGRLFVDASGRVYAPNSTAIGPGTSTPTRTLQLSDTTGQPAIKLTNDTSGHLTTDGADLTFTGTNLFITNREAGAIVAEANGSERARIDSSGRLLVGTSTASQWNHFSPDLPLQVARANSLDTAIQLTAFRANDQYGPNVIVGKSRSNTLGTNTAILDGDFLGELTFVAANGTSWSQGAGISARADGQTWANGDCPTRLVFSTTADGASSPTERMRISNAGTTTLTSASATGPFIAKIGATECARFNGTGYLKVTSNGSYQLQSGTYNEFYQTADSPTVWGSATNASYAQAVYYATAARAANAAYFFFVGTSSYGGIADDEFKLYGDGNGKCDGAWTGGGADYAEYFEWSDSNPDSEDRRGISVVLDGDKIREAQAGEDPIGVISGNPSVVGDAAWNKWSGKYLRDEFGTYIQEDYEVEDEDGNTVIQQRRKLNPAYDPDVEYVSREQRPEWDCVGLMGKLRIRKGQITGSRWIKMRDINDAVEEWLVR